MILYPDVLFLVNLIADYMLLRMTAKLTGHQLNRLRLLLVAAAGAGYAVISCMPWGQTLSHPIFHLISGWILGMSAFGWRHSSLRKTLVFFLLSCLLGGAIFALSFVSGGMIGFWQGTLYVHVSFTTLLLTIAAVYAVISAVSAVAVRRANSRADIYQADAVLQQHHAHFSVLADTGCMVADPLTNRPVMLVTLEAVSTILPDAFQNAMQNGDDTAEMIRKITCYGKPIHPVFCRGISGTTEMLPCFQPDLLTVNGKECSAVLAVFPSNLDDAEGFQAIVHPNAIEELSNRR